MQVLLASPRGFCAGVDRAIEIVDRTLELYGPPVYVLHEIVHNRHVLDDFRGRGVRFVEEMSEVPEGAVTIFSAHGVSEDVEQKGAERNLRVIDATCPLVTKVHLQAQRYERERRELILIGHVGHPEIEGTQGRVDGRVHVLCTPEEVEALEVENPERPGSQPNLRAILRTVREWVINLRTESLFVSIELTGVEIDNFIFPPCLIL